ncbi:uncharacterized protein RJT21DRAFT_1239 [Scheffersomyces amazonensis]|uniref:uncharacterized protein n=1 Tax=Scheffersomyces amazonensis TaxID=1078765 RepID=UPI00315CBEBC
MSDLKDFLEKRVRVISTDARLFEGILQGYDKSTNIVLSDCIERIIYSEANEPNQEIEMGLYLMRGGNIVCVGEVDEEQDDELDWINIKGDTLKGTKNPL